MSHLFISPQGFFTEAVRKGLEQRRLKTFPHVESYLVNLLQHYLDARNLFENEVDELGRKPPQTLAEMLLIAHNSEPAAKAELLKKLGDKSLYISGFFGDSLNRKIVDVDYYANMGGTAYATLANVTKEDALAKVYTTFSHQFMDFVDVLTVISQATLIKSNESVLRLYDRYMRTGSELAREKLVEMGVLTLPKEQLKAGRQS